MYPRLREHEKNHKSENRHAIYREVGQNPQIIKCTGGNKMQKKRIMAELETYGTAGTRAYTWSIGVDSDRVYLSLTEEYMSTAGNMYTSSPVVKTGSDWVSATYTPSGGRFVSAWSHHGRTQKSFTVYI